MLGKGGCYRVDGSIAISNRRRHSQQGPNLTDGQLHHLVIVDLEQVGAVSLAYDLAPADGVGDAPVHAGHLDVASRTSRSKNPVSRDGLGLEEPDKGREPSKAPKLHRWTFRLSSVLPSSSFARPGVRGGPSHDVSIPKIRSAFIEGARQGFA